ncbi:TolC family protein [Maridesulfovibrio salexigens]|uniref:Outer membrane efflux protein n=1 Tax=Maridesulfovibrio salexigens (strain ATCC 14822 / DSM 2638 / NCIMB 8403 / VKM B-1763) TaxID=526222 RepID=C6BT98_MARSD|nr:TolC family protein [Maridesulfovibrio salexigens]ACS81579.1 outer membrane efflux protein [Maridesulfovibrio salexigens DSM 2638]
MNLNAKRLLEINTVLLLTFICVFSLLLPAYAENETEAQVNNGTLTLSMDEVVRLTIRNNSNVATKYLQRVTEKFDLEKAEAKFEPVINIDGSFNAEAFQRNMRISDNGTQTPASKWDAGAKASITQKIPTGGTLSFVWDNNYSENSDGTLSYDGDSAVSRSKTYTREASSKWRIELTQPLLKGAGIDYNMASIRLARITDKRNILSLRDNLSQLINSGLNYYFTFKQAKENLEIQQQALERSERLLEVNQFKQSMGRMSASDVVQAEADVASGRLSLEEARNSLDKARRDLLNHLEMDPNLEIEPIDDEIRDVEPDYEQCMQVALKNNQTYMDKVFAVTESNINAMMAENEREWQLDLKGGYEETQTQKNSYSASTSDDELSAGVELSAPINLWGDDQLERKKKLLTAEVNKRKAKLELKRAKTNLQTEVANAVRDVRMRWKMIRLAQKNTELKALQLENENTKLMVGRTTNFEVVSYQNQLVQAQLAETSKQISYVQALLILDQLLGTTMETWHVEFKHNDKQLEEDLNNKIRPLVWTWW